MIDLALQHTKKSEKSYGLNFSRHSLVRVVRTALVFLWACISVGVRLKKFSRKSSTGFHGWSNSWRPRFSRKSFFSGTCFRFQFQFNILIWQEPISHRRPAERASWPLAIQPSFSRKRWDATPRPPGRE